MIEVSKPGNSSFPNIDFKFLNRGDASGVLWKIGVLIESIKIDQTPVISFRYYVNESDLTIVATNTGWGPANHLQVRVSEPLISELFPENSMSDSFTIGPNDSIEVITLSLNSAAESGVLWLKNIVRSRAAFLENIGNRMRDGDYALLQEGEYTTCLCNHERWRLTEYFNNLARGDDHASPKQQRHIEYMTNVWIDSIPLQNLSIQSKFEDVDSRTLKHDQSIPFSTTGNIMTKNRQVWVSEQGLSFKFYDPIGLLRINMCVGGMTPIVPAIKFVVMLDATKGPMERRYPMSLKLSAGDAGRFQIAIGANRSCHLKARFVFYFDSNNTIKSEVFDVSVWRPHGVSVYVKDGSQLVPTENGWRLADKSGHTGIDDLTWK